MENFDTWKLLAGLGIFLFGMFTLEDSIKNLAGRSFKRFIRETTTGKIRSIFSGTLVTAVLQSSSAVSLMVLAFVGAGIMAMENAIGVILGSNVGTTITAWIVAIFGFKLDIESFALPLIGIGGLGIVFLGQSKRYSNISKLLVGFGFLFMGLDFMKVSVEGLTDSMDLAALPSLPLVVYIGIGLVLTAVMQSSSATIAIILTALNAGIMTFGEAAAMVIGANVGTTVTVLIGSIGGSQIKKRVALSHLVFNVATAVVGFALLIPMTWAIGKLFAHNDNHLIGIAMFHTLFNVIGVLIFLPFIGLLTRGLARWLPERTTRMSSVIQNLTTDVPDAAISGIQQELKQLIRLTLQHNLAVLNIDRTLVVPPDALRAGGRKSTAPMMLYDQLKQFQGDIFAFAAKVQAHELSPEESHDIQRLLHAARQALHAAKSIKDVHHNFENFEGADNLYINNEYANFRKEMMHLALMIFDILELEDHDQIAADLTRLLKDIQRDDEKFIERMTSASAGGDLPAVEISSLLLVNRALIHSARKLIAAVREIKLTGEEAEMVESVLDAGRG